MDKYIQEQIELERQAEKALLGLANSFSLAAKYLLKEGNTDEIKAARAYGRGLRGQYTRFMKDFERFDEAATRLLVEDETAYRAGIRRQAAPPPPPMPASGKERKGTPRYERLKARPGWPWLINAEEALQAYGVAIDMYYLDQCEWAGPNTFDRKAVLMRRKFDKWAGRSASALHQLCVIASEYQRPCQQSFGGKPGKQALAALIKDSLEEWQELERQVLAAIQEAADLR